MQNKMVEIIAKYGNANKTAITPSIITKALVQYPLPSPPSPWTSLTPLSLAIPLLFLLFSSVATLDGPDSASRR